MTHPPKERAAQAALEFVRGDMTLGLGTGSTAAIFIDLLAEKMRAEGLDIRAIPTSEASHQQALAHGIPLIEPDETTIIDLDIDGADEIDPDGNLIKGGGGALLREKIIAAAARQFVVIADGTKEVEQLGAFPLPVEIDRFGWALSVRAMREILSGFGHTDVKLALRSDDAGHFVLSDGGNYIVDAHLGRIGDVEGLDRALTAIPGVVTTGLFVNLAPLCLIGTDDGVIRRHG
ncbi:MAG: ribose-5-phosphate isomerase RpiA [Parvularcula sp.]